MTSFRVRPKVRFETEMTVPEIVDLINQQLAAKHYDVRGKAYPTHVHLEVKTALQHFWSPQLDLSIDDSEPGKVILRGRYGPRRNIWLLFTFGYIIFGIGLFFSLMIWGSMFSLHQPNQWHYLVILFSVLLVALYFIAQTGQKLGSEQTFILHHFLEETLHEKGEFV